ncbi:MAG: SHOCT domain-containing protein, partial [Ktedonobacteraceae bacterium]
RWLNKPTTTLVPPKTNTLASNMSAIEILRQRYARGEIDGATFEQMRERIEASEGRGYQQ